VLRNRTDIPNFALKSLTQAGATGMGATEGGNMLKLYQDHDGTGETTSDSRHKLDRFRMPDMTGKTFLDIGSNEGLFLNAALERGAVKAVGLDRDQRRLDFCRERYPDSRIELHCQTWDTLPPGLFDVVLLASSMHYEPDPAALLQRIADKLTPDGLLILELGVTAGHTMEMVRVARRNRVLWYPTEMFLMNRLLRPFAPRRVAKPELTGGDPVPRSVYHCLKRLPLVLVFRGRYRSGKSSAARLFGGGATKVINLDAFVDRMVDDEFPHGDLAAFLAEKHDMPTPRIIREIDSKGLTEQFVAVLAEAIVPSDESVVIEGFLTDEQVDALERALEKRAWLWEAKRRGPKWSEMLASQDEGEDETIAREPARDDERLLARQAARRAARMAERERRRKERLR
jgi:SAM-dependent methyltransferase